MKRLELSFFVYRLVNNCLLHKHVIMVMFYVLNLKERLSLLYLKVNSVFLKV